MHLQIIIVILPCHQHGYPWHSLATPSYNSSLPAGPQGYTPYPHRAAVWRFELVALLLHGYVNTVYRSSSLMRSSLHLEQCSACLVRLTWIVFVIGGRTAVALCSVASRTCSILLADFLYSCRRAFSPAV